MSHRYLLHISYLGTRFRGLQKLPEKQQFELKSTVQGSIELGLKLLPLRNEPQLILSSRTDAGVHAINSSVHVDLQSKSGHPHHPATVVNRLNRFFFRENLQIRVNEAEIVPDTFHARFSAKRRTYLYRLAVAKHEPVDRKLSPYIPVDEIDRCYFVKNPKFDTDLARKAAELLKGRHDFRTFMGSDATNSGRDHPFFAHRHIDSIKIEGAQSTCNAITRPLADEHYHYIDIQISGRSFLNRQVRRTVATILGVAQHRLTIREVYEMLTIPSKHSWPSRIEVLPAQGLYLCQVEYDSKDKEFPSSDANCATEAHPVENELP